MKFKEWFKNFVINVKGGVSRFMTAFVFSVILFGLLSSEILWGLDIDCFGDMLFALPLGMFVSVLMIVVSEKTKLPKWVADILAVLAVIICFVTTYYIEFYGNHFWMGYWGLIIASVCFTVAMLASENNRLVNIPHLLKSLLFTWSVSTILSAGVSLCLWAFQVLVYDFDYDIYVIVNLFIWIVLVVNLFLAYLPKKDEEIKLPKLFKVIVANVALPIYILLMVILYVYLAKIIITWNMPVGQINWFASFATLFFVFFVFCVRQYDDKFTKLFTRLAGWFVIPVIIMQLVAIYERVSAYGLTTPRTISLILVAVGIIFAVVALLGKRLERVLWAVGIIVLVFTVVPKINILDMPAASQVNLLEKYLVKNNMYADGVITPNEDIDEYDKDRIRSAYNYMIHSECKLPDWINKVKDQNFKTVFGFERYETSREGAVWEYYKYSCSTEAGKFFDIADYRKMQFVKYTYSEEYPLFETTIDGEKYSFDMKKVFKEIKEEYEDVEFIKPVKLNENIVLYLDYAYYNLCDYEVSDLYFDGYLFIK